MERSKEVSELISQKGYFYVCGDAANMAREVHTVLAQILAEGRGVSEAKGEEIVKNMRSANQYQVCRSIRLTMSCIHEMGSSLIICFTGGCLVIKRERQASRTSSV